MDDFHIDQADLVCLGQLLSGSCMEKIIFRYRWIDEGSVRH